MTISLTQHARVRCGERSIRENDCELVIMHGEPRNCYGDVTEYRFTPKVAGELIAEKKREIHRLEKLQGTVFRVSQEGVVVTVFRRSKKKPARGKR